MRKTILRCIFATLLSAGAAVPAAAQWPTRPITLTVAFAAGGVTDGVARKIAIELGKKLSGDVVVENKGGAGGGLAAMAVIRSAADGYSLLFASSGPAALNKLIYKKLAYDPQKDLTPIVLVGFIPQVIAAKPTLPVNNLKEFVEYAKKHQGKMTFGNSGIGTTSQIAAAWFSHDTGIQATHVAYRGTAPLVNDVMGGQIDAGFPGFFPQTTSLKLLAVTSDKRIEALPDVPTVKETGVADLTSGLWFGLMGPANLPRPIVDRINKIVNDYLATDEAKTIARTVGKRILGGTPEDMRDLAANEIKRLRPIVEEAKISVD
jgi:tripartite-type tricarboxylate transporter receptor subunit TctC